MTDKNFLKCEYVMICGSVKTVFSNHLAALKEARKNLEQGKGVHVIPRWVPNPSYVPTITWQQLAGRVR